MPRWTKPALLALAGKTLFNCRLQSNQSARISKLQLHQMEDRVVLDAVAPGATWSDGKWEPYAPGRIAGSATASRDIYAVSATGDVAEEVSAQNGFIWG